MIVLKITEKVGRYGPGACLITMSGLFVHTVEKWESMPMKDMPEQARQRGVTPGRYGMVCIFPAPSFKALRGRLRGWAVETMFGMQARAASRYQSIGETMDLDD